MSEMNIGQGQLPNQLILAMRNNDIYQPQAQNQGFYLFPELPIELRLKIFKLAAHHSRIIEIEAGRHKTQEGNWARVTPRSRGIPPILRVNREARKETLKIYDVVSFDRATHFIGSRDRNIYFNAADDILLFGENTCINTVLDTIRLHQDIQNVGLFCCSRGEDCCSLDNQTTGVTGGCNYLQALHGFDPSVTNHEYRLGGCKSLKNIYFVVKSALWPQKVGKLDPTTAFRPATSTGLTKAQVRFHSELENRMQMVENGVELGVLGGNVWMGDQKPKISLVSFSKLRGGRGDGGYRGGGYRGGGYKGDGYGLSANGGGGYGGGARDRILLTLSRTVNPAQHIVKDLVLYGSGNQGGYGGGYGGGIQGADYRICDGMVVSRKELLKLTSKSSRFIKSVERSTGCTIEIPEEMHKYQDHREIGFWGWKENVCAAKRCINERLGRL